MFDQYTPNVKAAIFSAFVVVGLAALGAAYQVGYGNGAKDLETVNDFRKADLPRMMNDIKILAKDFRDRAELTEENQRVTKEISDKTKEISDQNVTNERLKQEIASQQDNISRLKKSVEELENTVSKLFATDGVRQTVLQGKAERVNPNVVTIGVVTIYDNFVRVTINGHSDQLYPGGNHKEFPPGRECTIELVNIDKPGLAADFVVSCTKR